jgi:predicted DNA-binding transcriptional regulator AlpA
MPLPDNFYEVHKAWREKKLTLKQAAQTVGMAEGTFYGKARKFEKVG